MSLLEKVELNPKINLEKGKVYPFVEMANVGFYTRKPLQIGEKAFTSGAKFEDGDTVIARITPCLQNGKGFYCHNIGKGFGSTEYLVFRPKDSTVDNQYLYYFMQTNYIRESMIKSMVGATGRQRVNNDVFDRIEFEFPDIDTQKRIASILATYDDLIENNQKQIKLLEEAAQRLYKEWFVDLRFPGHEDVAIVDGVPEGWKRTTINEIVQVLRRGISPKYNENANTMVINQKCIRQMVVTYVEARMQEKEYPIELALQDSDTVICSTGAGTLGRVGQIFGKISDTTIDSHVTLVRAKKDIGKQFLFWSLKEYQNYFMNSGKGSTNQLELNRDTIGRCQILIPEAECLDRFEKYAQTIHDKITVCSEQLIFLKQARDRLLPKLMSGEIEV